MDAKVPASVIVSDASVLINFLVVGRVDLFGPYARRVLVTEHVGGEVSLLYPEERQRYEEALARGLIEEVRVDARAELELFAGLAAPGRLGAGECSAIAVAVSRRFAVAIDDRRAIRQGLALAPGLEVLGTQGMVVEMIRAGLLSVEEADRLLDTWAREHRFRLRIDSFADVV